MSKKTEQIYKAIDALEELKNQISIINQLKKAKSGIDENSDAEQSRHLENIEFEMGQQLKALRFWIGSLYSYNGRSTSRAKQAASKENGKKGGRPPKEITLMRRRAKELEQILDELHSQKIVTTDFSEEERLSAQFTNYETELNEIKAKLSEKTTLSGGDISK